MKTKIRKISLASEKLLRGCFAEGGMTEPVLLFANARYVFVELSTLDDAEKIDAMLYLGLLDPFSG